MTKTEIIHLNACYFKKMVSLHCLFVLAKELCKHLKENVLSFLSNIGNWTLSILIWIRASFLRLFENRRGFVNYLINRKSRAST